MLGQGRRVLETLLKHIKNNIKQYDEKLEPLQCYIAKRLAI